MDDPAMASPEASRRGTMRRVWSGSFAPELAPCLFFAGVSEGSPHRLAPRSGVTPFQISEDHERPHSLRPSCEATDEGPSLSIRVPTRGGPPHLAESLAVKLQFQWLRGPRLLELARFLQ